MAAPSITAVVDPRGHPDQCALSCPGLGVGPEIVGDNRVAFDHA